MQASTCASLPVLAPACMPDLLSFCFPLSSQVRGFAVSGRVVDGAGQGIAGVSVSVDGEAKAVTDNEVRREGKVVIDGKVSGKALESLPAVSFRCHDRWCP